MTPFPDCERRRRAPLLTAVAVAAALVTAPATLQAANVKRVSDAPTLSPGTPYLSAPTSTNCCDAFFRLDTIVRPGDRLQFAFDNSTNSETLYPWMIGPTDDFGVENEIDASNFQGVFGPSVSKNSFGRLVFTYTRPTGQPFLWVHNYFDREPFAVTFERVIPYVGVGFTLPGRIGHTIRVKGSARWGDNTGVGPGHRAVARWRLPKERRFARSLGAGAIDAGRFNFRASVPRAAWGKQIKVQLCVTGSAKNSLKCVVRTAKVSE